MGNTVSYSDTRFGVEKILKFPAYSIALANSTLAQFVMTEDILITEFGVMISQTLTNSGNIVIKIEESAGANEISTLTLNSASSIGTVQRTTSISDDDAIDSGNTLRLFFSSAEGASIGVVDAYIKYRARFAT